MITNSSRSPIFCIVGAALLIGLFVEFMANGILLAAINQLRTEKFACKSNAEEMQGRNFRTKCPDAVNCENFRRYSIDFGDPSLEEIRNKFPDLLPGGEWQPSDCVPNDHVAILIPYADRPLHLRSGSDS